MKIMLQDIDNVSYPFKEKHVEYLLEQELISQELAEKILKSKKPYIIDYLILENKNGNNIQDSIKKIQKKYGEQAIILKEKIQTRNLNTHKDEPSLEIESLLFATFDDFRKSEHFQTGKIKEIIEMNQKLKKEHPELKIIGITARAVHAKKEPELYKEITGLTYSWNEKNKVCLDEIFFERNKILAYNEIINKPEYKNHEIICFVEDDPKNIEEFLKENITCILIFYEHHEQEKLVERLQKQYPQKLFVAETHKDAVSYIETMVN